LVDAAKTIPHRDGGAGRHHRQNAGVLLPLSETRGRAVKAWLAGRDAIPKPAGNRWGNTYPNGSPLTGLFRYFQFDSLARVCFLSVSDPRDIECTDFSGGVANGGRA
jgi:hypothetical protein